MGTMLACTAIESETPPETYPLRLTNAIRQALEECGVSISAYVFDAVF